MRELFFTGMDSFLCLSVHIATEGRGPGETVPAPQRHGFTRHVSLIGHTPAVSLTAF